MGREYKVIDADGHILEPVDLWDNYIDPTYRARAPRMFTDTDGKDRLNIDGIIIGGPRGLGRLGAIGLRDGRAPEDMKYSEGRKGGFDPHARIKDLDLDGIDAAFLYPSIGLFSGAIKDPDLAWAMCRAYNRWLADYCAYSPKQLFGIATIVQTDLERAIRGAKKAREMGLVGVFLRPNPSIDRKFFCDPVYDPLWAALQDLDLTVGFHPFLANDLPGACSDMGIGSFVAPGARSMTADVKENGSTGMIGINSFAISVPESPFGGVKESGHGSEEGIEGLEACLVTKFITES